MPTTPDLSLAPAATKVAEIAEFKQTGKAANLQEALRDLRASPAAFVVPLRNAAGRNALDSAGTVMQRVSFTFGVVLMIRNVRDARGDKAADELAALRAKVFDKLLGIQLAAEFDTCLYSGGQLMRFSDQDLIWQDVFTTAFHARKV